MYTFGPQSSQNAPKWWPKPSQNGPEIDQKSTHSVVHKKHQKIYETKTRKQVSCWQVAHAIRPRRRSPNTVFRSEIYTENIKKSATNSLRKSSENQPKSSQNGHRNPTKNGLEIRTLKNIEKVTKKCQNDVQRAPERAPESTKLGPKSTPDPKKPIPCTTLALKWPFGRIWLPK